MKTEVDDLRDQVRRIAEFAAEVLNAKKDPTAICINCGVIQHDQLDRICTTCNRAELANITELREKLLATREQGNLAYLVPADPKFMKTKE